MEREVAAFAATGHHDRLIAYNFGLPYQVVDCFVARAAMKLGVRSRHDPIRRFEVITEGYMSHVESAVEFGDA